MATGRTENGYINEATTFLQSQGYEVTKVNKLKDKSAWEEMKPHVPNFIMGLLFMFLAYTAKDSEKIIVVLLWIATVLHRISDTLIDIKIKTNDHNKD